MTPVGVEQTSMKYWSPIQDVSLNSEIYLFPPFAHLLIE